MTPRRVGSSALITALVAIASCSSGAATAPTLDAGVDADAAASFACESDPRAQTYTAKMSAVGQGGTFTFVLVSSDPAPPARGNNAWIVDVLDASSARVPDVTLTFSATMPDHGHGTSVVPTITKQADGTFSVNPVYLFMPGIWQVTLTATANGKTDRATFTFCVAG